MKTQISRWSHDPSKRRSGIYQQQGRMITDADLNELVELLKQRVDDALGDLVGTGVPRSATGAVSNGPTLNRGPIYADGVRAELQSSTGTTTFALNQQADFPGAPAWAGGTAKLLYADVWEWSYTALQDAGLLDPGLHGADTSTRTQTLAQVKLCAVPGGGGNPDCLNNNKNPAKGNATLTLDIRQASNAVDPCDPCASEISLDGRIGNYLFRLEVHDVQGPANAPTEITLKWSSENGAEQHSQDNVPADFKRGDWFYEFYSNITERHLGVHLDGFAPQRGVLKDSWPALTTDVPDKIQYPYVRRWDGYAILVNSGGTWSVKVVSGKLQAKDKGRPFALLGVGATPTHGDYTIDTKLVAHLSSLKLTLDVDGKKFVAGDYWLAAVREDAESANRVQQAGEYTETGTSPNIVRHYKPIGVTHHYVLLAHVNGAGAVQPANDADTRRRSFPPLTDLTADRIGYDPTVAASRWSDIQDADAARPANVQQAIDELIENLESSDVRYSLLGCEQTGYNVSTLKVLLAAAIAARQGAEDLKIKHVLDALLCDLDAAKIPYNPTPAAARWRDIKEIAGGAPLTAPSTVQQAIDDLLQHMESGDVRFDLPACTPASVRKRLPALAGLADGTTLQLDTLLTALLCQLDAAAIPVVAGGGTQSISDLMVRKTGDTMTGALVINPSVAVATSLDVQGTLEADQFRLIAPPGTPDKAVLTYDLATGLAKWLETSLTAWNLTGGNLSTNAGAVTGTVTIGRPTTINGNLQLNGSLTGSGAAAFAAASHNHDARYPWSEFSNSDVYTPGQERKLATFVDRPKIVTFVYQLIDSGTGMPLADSYVNGPLSNNIQVRIRKIAGSGGQFDKDYELWVRNNNGVQLYISVEVFG